MRRTDAMTELSRFLRCNNGATAIEYAMIAAGVSIAVIGGVTSLGSTINETFYQKLQAVIGSSGSGS